MYTIGNMILCTVIRLGATLSLSIGITVYSKLLITVTGMDWTLKVELLLTLVFLLAIHLFTLH